MQRSHLLALLALWSSIASRLNVYTAHAVHDAQKLRMQTNLRDKGSGLNEYSRLLRLSKSAIVRLEDRVLVYGLSD